MGNYTTTEIIVVFLYITGSLMLLITSYLLYLKRFKKRKMKAMNNLVFETSITNKFKGKTQFLIISPEEEELSLELLDENEEKIGDIIQLTEVSGHLPVNFDTASYKPGNYFLYLKSKNATILRKIEIYD